MKDDITRKDQMRFLSVEFVIGLLIQSALFFFLGIRVVGALENRIVVLESQRVDPVAVGKLEESVSNLSVNVAKLEQSVTNLRQAIQDL